ncbi:hypothetical protein ACJX0J_017146 [Zea mays]
MYPLIDSCRRMFKQELLLFDIILFFQQNHRVGGPSLLFIPKFPHKSNRASSNWNSSVTVYCYIRSTLKKMGKKTICVIMKSLDKILLDMHANCSMLAYM